MMQKDVVSNSLQPGCYYHIYNRGNNREHIFIEKRNYYYFLKLYAKYIGKIADTFAYCLLPNHFHLLVKIRNNIVNPSRDFATFFGTYSKAINKYYNRTGSLFEKPFHRNVILYERHLTKLVVYFHHNPEKHSLVNDYKDWAFSSYKAIISEKVSTQVQRQTTLDWFGGREMFIDYHIRPKDLDE